MLPRAGLPAGTRLCLAALQIIPQSSRQPVRMVDLGSGRYRLFGAGFLRWFGSAGRHESLLEELGVGLDDPAFQVNRSVLSSRPSAGAGSVPGPARGARIHQAMERPD